MRTHSSFANLARQLDHFDFHSKISYIRLSKLHWKKHFQSVAAFCNRLAFLFLEEERKTALKAFIGCVLAAASASLWRHSTLSVTSPPVCWLSDNFHHISVDRGEHHVVAAPRFYSIYVHDCASLHSLKNLESMLFLRFRSRFYLIFFFFFKASENKDNCSWGFFCFVFLHTDLQQLASVWPKCNGKLFVNLQANV